MRGSPLPAVRTLLAAAAATALIVAGTQPAHAADQPWTNAAQTPDQRAAELLAAMTQAEKLTMLHGGSSCGYVGCIDANIRLGIPALHLQDGRPASATASPASPSSPRRSRARPAGTPP